MRRLLSLLVFMGLFSAGCAGTVREIITCDPPQADIYWGQTQSDVAKSDYKTPHSRSVSRSSPDKRCYQVKKDGYHDSDIKCREEEEYRFLEFRLDPIKTTITSEPPGATIYWGPSRNQLTPTIHRTPRTVYNVKNGASWKDWYFQVKKEGYGASEIVFLPQQSKDRFVHFDLESAGREKSVGEKRAIAYDQNVYQVQKKLKELGYNPGPIDGIMGKKTKSAIKSFQRDNGLRITGEMDEETKKELEF